MVRAYVFFFELLGQFFDRYSAFNDHETTEDEIEAGIDALQEFPPYISTCKALMERFGQPIDYFLLDWDADTLFMFLLHDYTENQIRKNLEQIRAEAAMFQK